MDLASVVAALASVGVRVSGSTPNSSVQGDSSRACPTGLAGPEPSGTFHDPGQHFQLDTDAFDIVIGTDFLRRNPQVKMLSLQRPYSLHCDFGSGLFSVPLELSGRKESGLRYASKTNYRTENYQLARHVLENGLAALQVNLDEIQVELFASQQQHIMQLYCSKQLNNAFRFFWKAMGLAYANPPFSLLAKVLTKIAYEGGRVVMCTPDWGCSGEHAYWCRMLD